MRTIREKLLAFGDLSQQYGRAFAHAWQTRREHERKDYLDYEAQFLPAALSLQEAPPSPAPRWAIWLLMSFAALALLWAIFGKIDIVATAQGKIVPNGRTKIIQPIEAATVAAIHVTDGQAVRAGQVLIELDATTAAADGARVANDLTSARLQAARARALLATIDAGRFSRIAAQPGIEPLKLEAAQRLLEGQALELSSKIARIDADFAKREAELQSVREMIRKVEQTAPIARQRAQDFKNLVDKNFVSKHGYMEREQAHIEQEADLATLRSRLKESEAALLETRYQKTALSAEARRTALDSLSEAEQKMVTLQQDLIKADRRTAVMTLLAPVSGTVQQLAVHTVGGVVTPAQPLMMIVPNDDALEVEAFLENKDVGFVSAGQDAETKIETFPYTKYGTVHAKVVHVSHDAINDEKRGLIYAVRVKMERATLRLENQIVNLTPGMAVTVEIKTGTRRVIEYFLSPLLQYGNESLRER